MQMYCQQVPVWTRSHVRCLLLSCDDRVKTHFAKIGRIFLTVLTHTTQPLLLYCCLSFCGAACYHLVIGEYSTSLESLGCNKNTRWCHFLLTVSFLLHHHALWHYQNFSADLATLDMMSLRALCPVEMTSSCPLCPVEMASICTLGCRWDQWYIPLGLCIWSGLCCPIWASM